MADQSAASGGFRQPSEEELEVAFSGPAILANRFYVTLGPTGARIAFAEQQSSEKDAEFRSAVILPFQDALALSTILATLLGPLSEVIAKQAGAVTSDG